jgi:RNA polymerase sigma factor (sigma-70 family)
MGRRNEMTDKEKELLLGCLAGDKFSWDAFVSQYSGLIYHTIKKTFSIHHAEPIPDSVDDLFQEIFLSLVKDNFLQLRRFRGDHGCTLASWLRMIATRRTIDVLRKAKKPERVLKNLPSSAVIGESAPFEFDEQYQLLAAAIANFSPGERIMIDLFFYRNLSAQDVASILHLSVGAVYTQKSRILAKLRETLNKSSSL